MDQKWNHCSAFLKCCNFFKTQQKIMRFFLNHIYVRWKRDFWGFPENPTTQKRGVDHQSGQANPKNKIHKYNLLDHFDGLPLFSGWSDSLENSRNRVSSERRYCFKKSHQFVLSFEKVTAFQKKWPMSFFSGVSDDFTDIPYRQMWPGNPKQWACKKISDDGVQNETFPNK